MAEKEIQCLVCGKAVAISTTKHSPLSFLAMQTQLAFLFRSVIEVPSTCLESFPEASTSLCRNCRKTLSYCIEVHKQLNVYRLKWEECKAGVRQTIQEAGSSIANISNVTTNGIEENNAESDHVTLPEDSQEVESVNQGNAGGTSVENENSFGGNTEASALHASNLDQNHLEICEENRPSIDGIGKEVTNPKYKQVRENQLENELDTNQEQVSQQSTGHQEVHFTQNYEINGTKRHGANEHLQTTQVDVAASEFLHSFSNSSSDLFVKDLLEGNDFQSRENKETTNSVTVFEPRRLRSSKQSCVAKPQRQNKTFKAVGKNSKQEVPACKVCGKTFTSAQGKACLSIHAKTHLSVKPFKCKLCAKTFPWKTNLERHIQSHLEEKLFKCKTCGNRFARQANLNQHMTTHSTEQPFSCDICGSKFKIERSLKSHKKHYHSRKQAMELRRAALEAELFT